MSRNPSDAVVTYLDTAVGALTDGTNLFRGKMRAKGPNIPLEAVFVLASGGAEMDSYMGGSTEERKNPALQIMIRSERDASDAFQSGEALARSIRDALHKAVISGYDDVRCVESEPNYVAEATEGYHLWTINVEMKHVE